MTDDKNQYRNIFYVEGKPEELWASLSYIDEDDNWSIIDYTQFSTIFLNSSPIRQEVDLFFCSRKTNYDSTNLFLKKWNFYSLSCDEYYTLSGGTKKRLILALQIESIKENNLVIVFNIQEQLDSQNTQLAFKNILDKKPSRVFIADSQPEQLFAKINYRLPYIPINDIITCWKTYAPL